MVNPHVSNKGLKTFLIILLVILLWPLICGASSKPISEADLDNADPVELRSPIMAIDYAKGTLVVAEKEVMIIDLMIGNERFTTQVTNAAGDAISFGSLAIGQNVMVQGLKLGDGRVLAALVQQL